MQTLAATVDVPQRVRTGSRPMTIFIVHPSDLVTDHRPHGDGTVAWGFISELGRRGHRVHVACERIDLAEPPPANVTLHPIPLRRKSATGRAIEYAVRCRLLYERLARRERFDVAHQLNPVFGGLSLALLGSGIPVVLGPYVATWPCNWEGLPWTVSARHEIARRILLYCQQSSAAALLVTTNAAMETKIVDSAAIRARVRRQPHGINVAEYAPRPEERERALASARILFLANVGPRKGILPLVEAFAGVYAVRPDARLVIGGDGPILRAVRVRVAELGLTDAVEVLGNVERADIAAHLRSSAVYCLPSFGEPYGMTAIEAMAAGLPLVVTDTGGLAEVAGEQGAIRVPPRDVPALRDALLAVLQSPERARAMGDHNMGRARDEFDWSVVVDSLESAYAAVRGVAAVQR
jgi:glycosyltransferase involved in cell wall biosynthesis